MFVGLQVLLVFLVKEIFPLRPCDIRLTTIITEGILHDNYSIEYDGLLYHEDQYFLGTDSQNITNIYGCICLLKKCYRKCCKRGQVMDGHCIERNVSEEYNKLKIFDGKHETDLVVQDHFLEIIGMACGSTEARILEPNEGHRFYLQRNGSLFYRILTYEFHVPPEEFCIEMYDKHDFKYLTALVCKEKNSKVIRPYTYAALMIISLPFLLATYLIYVCIPELRNIHGRCTENYVFSIFVAYLFLIFVYMSGRNINKTLCLIFPFFTYFGYMASFLWLNVMCFDIWFTFSGKRSFRTDKLSEKKKFIYYSIYAWGLSSITLIITIVLQFIDPEYIPEYVVRPRFAVKKCWFPDSRTQGYYMFGPILFLILVNVVLFVWTAVNIFIAKRNTARSMRTDSQTHMRDCNQRFMLYLKLFLAFGVNWSFELIPWLWGKDPPFQILMDILNILYGVVIFYFSVCKRSVLKHVKNRYQLFSHSRTPQSGDTRMSDMSLHSHSK